MLFLTSYRNKSHSKFHTCDVRHALLANIYPKYLEVMLTYSLDSRVHILHSLYVPQQRNMGALFDKHKGRNELLFLFLHEFIRNTGRIRFFTQCSAKIFSWDILSSFSWSSAIEVTSSTKPLNSSNTINLNTWTFMGTSCLLTFLKHQRKHILTKVQYHYFPSGHQCNPQSSLASAYLIDFVPFVSILKYLIISNSKLLCKVADLLWKLWLSLQFLELFFLLCAWQSILWIDQIESHQ